MSASEVALEKIVQELQRIGGPDWVSLVLMCITALGVIVAIASLILQQRASARKEALENLFRMIEIFMYGERMLAARNEAAAYLLTGKLSRTAQSPSLYEVLGFFELLGTLVRKRGKLLGSSIIDPEMAWSHFHSWALAYWVASSDLISKDVGRDRSLWEDYEELVEIFLRIEDRRRGRALSWSEIEAEAWERIEMEAQLGRADPGRFSGPVARR